MFFSTTASEPYLAVGMAAVAVKALGLGPYAQTAFDGVIPPLVPPKTYKTFFTTAALADAIPVG